MCATLAVLAAGIGARFGGGVKQLQPVGPNGELIIDYSIHDAIAAGFDRIIFIIRHDIEDDFREVIGDRMERVCESLGVEVSYAFQELADIPGCVPEGREKPWGTGQAVLACRDMLHEPFAVINADDYYGTDGFKKAAEFLKTGGYALIGYILKNTLSDHGGVTRGICSVEDGKLVGIDETENIVKTADGAESEGRSIPVDSLVSMNFWCLPESFMDELRRGLPEFLANMKDPQKDEYLLPIIVDGLLKKGQEVSVLMTGDKWFGMTYKDDVESVRKSFGKLYEKGVYNGEDLYGDLKSR